MKQWDNELWLLTPAEYELLPDGVRLKCIDDTYAVKGADYIDQDVRFGCLAFGLTEQLIREQNLDHDLTVMLLGS